MTQLYDITFTAEGEVRDAEGNLKGVETFTETVRVTEEQLKEILAAQQKETEE